MKEAPVEIQYIPAGRRAKPVTQRLKHPKISPEMVDAHTWYALRVQSQREFLSQVLLQRKGILTYVPVRKEWRHKNKYDKALKKEKVLISYPETVGYVFAGFSPNQLVLENIPVWVSIFAIPTVKSAVGVSGRPLAIDRGSLKRLVKDYPNGMQRPDREQYMRTFKEFKEGDDVRICSGPFEGHIVPVKEIANGMARLPVTFLGEEHEITMNCFDLERDVA